MNRFASASSRRFFLNCVLLLAGANIGGAASAFQVSSFSPQKEVAQVRQVVVKFDEAAIRFGDAKAPDPLTLSCSDADASKGTGRWNSEREWVFEFSRDLPPGVRCTAQFNQPLASVAGQPLKGTQRFQFNTGGPFVSQIWPRYGAIDEEQLFVLQLNGAATAESLQASLWCNAEGVGERLPVKLVDGKTREAVLKNLGLTRAAAIAPQRFVTLGCPLRLTPATRMQLVYGKGVATPSGVANQVEKRFDFQVREPFTASFSCERENAQAACLPIRPMSLRFTAPIPRKQAEAIRLKSEQQTYSPTLDSDEAGAALVSSVSFKALFNEQTKFTLELPKDLRDDAGRALANADSFPLAVATATMPPLAKFAAAPFGIVERFAEPGLPPLLPVTLRKVEAVLPAQALQVGGKVNALQPQTDADIIRWFQRVKRYDNFWITRKQAAKDVQAALPPSVGDNDVTSVQSRMVSLLQGQPGLKALQLPKPNSADPRPFEVVGIPLTPGFHVLELESAALGQALLDDKFGIPRRFYVRTSALVTNLAVHFKSGRENAVAWVTSLDKGQPVANARVQVSDCQGQVVARATTDANGIAQLPKVPPEAPLCRNSGDSDDDYRNAWFVSARATGADQVEDLAFTWSDWQRGIEPWRFNLPTSREALPDQRAHTVLDRSLLRVGETVSMKHLLRSESSQGFGLPAKTPDTLVITHTGSGQRFAQPLAWRKTATGGLSADNTWQVPPGAKLGQYEIALQTGGANDIDSGRSLSSGQFRVEEFRLPVLQGRVGPAQKGPLVNAQAVTADVQVNFVSGGPAANLPVRVSALVRERWLVLRDYDDFSFTPPRAPRSATPQTDSDSDEEEPSAAQDQRVVASRLALTLDKNGTGRVALPKLPASPRPQDLLMEATYADPNGEVQTLRGSTVLWPAAVMTGIKAESWTSVTQKAVFQAVALDLNGKPQAGVKLDVKAVARIVTSSRKRLVGGFYSYDNRTELKDLGSVCSGKSDARGLLVCEARIEQPGEVELVVTAHDAESHTIQAATSIFITRQGELWFGGENHDRMDLLAEKKSYQPGEIARFQVRMPFRFATALVAVEREGVVETQVVQLNGKDPTISLKVQDGWAPNVYVSVLALRGRLRDVPWYSFFTWGYKTPSQWWTAFWHEGRDYVAPTALVDLSKPAYRLGTAEIRVGAQAHQLKVTVKADKESYPVRGQAKVTISATRPDGQPAANAEVAVAAVDQALLELSPNKSWNLLEAMLQRRSWGVETSTAQMEIIGRRHYGRKAVAAGGGGGRSPTRELLDTLLLWNPRVLLDANGQATITVPLNDALTSFKIVAVADAEAGLFGTGQTSIRATQDLQIISGLPPLVREEDQYRAQFTLRNTTARAMKVEVSPRATLLTLKPQTVELAAGESKEVTWDVTAPAQLAFTRAEAILWEIDARETGATGSTPARDALKASQRIAPAVPVTVQQATLVQLDGSYSLAVQPPPEALSTNGQVRGGLKLGLQAKLADGLPGVQDWFARYPYTCLEQKTSKAIGLRDAKLWQTLVAQLPGYLDGDGLATYFPPRDGDSNRGSDALTAYLLLASAEAASQDPSFALPTDARALMERGLIAFVEGRISRSGWSPQKDLDVRKLAALDALARGGKARGRMLASITVAPNQWPTHAVLHWANVLQRVTDAPQRSERLAEAMQILRARLAYQGTRMGFSTDSSDGWWWLMASADTNAAQLLLTVMDDAAWKDDMGRLATGLLARQQRGAWGTTTANLWGSLALRKFSTRFESTPVTGTTRANTAVASGSVDWAKAATAASPSITLPWGKDTSADKLSVTQQGTGKPWLTLQSLAAVPLTQAFSAGYQIKKTLTPMQQAVKGQFSRGDTVRVTLEINATADMTWVVVSDPIPGGTTILGSGLRRDSEIATQGEKQGGNATPVFEERSFEALRSYFDYLPKGNVKVEYTVRLNNVGDFALPPTRVEAMYAPEVYGELPNARVKVGATK